jgi:hypothetical protein
MSNQTMRYLQQGVNSVAAYQVSGIPWITGSAAVAAETKFEFPTVSRTITVINSGSAPLLIHFNSSSDGNVIGGHHYVTLPGDGDSFTFNVKSKEVFVTPVGGSTGVEIVAELTSVPARDFPQLTGSGLTE